MAKCPANKRRRRHSLRAGSLDQTRITWVQTSDYQSRRRQAACQALECKQRSPHLEQEHNSDISTLPCEAPREFDRPKTKALARRAAAAITIGFSRSLVIWRLASTDSDLGAESFTTSPLVTATPVGLPLSIHLHTAQSRNLHQTWPPHLHSAPLRLCLASPGPPAPFVLQQRLPTMASNTSSRLPLAARLRHLL